MRNAQFIISARKLRGAFTVLELMVVVAVISVLLALLLPVVTKIRESARRAQCASNLQQIGGQLLMYGQDNNNSLPANRGIEASYLLWDIPMITRNLMMGYGFSRNLAYCPSNQGENIDALWNYDNVPSSGLSVTGYFWLIPRTSWGNDLYNNPGDFNHTPNQPIYAKKFTTAGASSYEMMTDATLSLDNSFSQYGLAVGTLVNHYKYGTDTPDGGNILFLDGHVAWRDFSSMYSRYGAGCSGLGTPGAGLCGMAAVHAGLGTGARLDQWW